MRKRLKNWLVAATAMTCVTVSVAGFVGCKPETEEPPVVKFEGAGTYYYEDAGELNDVLVKEDGSVTLSRNNVSYEGTLSFEGTSVTFTFADVEGKSIVWTGTYADGQFVVKDTANVTVTFLKKVNYNVTFDSVGGSSVGALSVLNGQEAEKPANPTKNGFVFVGWYADADYTTAWSFATQVVTGDVKLYAYWVPESAQAYTVSFDLGYDGAPAIESQTTYDKVRNLPTPERAGHTFLGWWASMYGDADKLSYQVTKDTEIVENTVLYAQWKANGSQGLPAVSVTDKQITWKAIGGVTSYTVSVKNDKGEPVVPEATDGATTRVVDFASLPAGDYVVTVTATGLEPVVRYYKNKALPSVSVFEIVNSYEFMFQPVAGAEKYYLTVDCGNDLHNHVELDLGDSTSYNFSDCPMQEGGITFVVRAEAEGKADSVSQAFVVNRVLDEVGGFKYDKATETISWSPVTGATGYVVNVKVGGQTAVTELDLGDKTSYSLKNFAAGSITVSVYATAKGYNPSKASEYVCEKQSLAAPSELKVEGDTLTWKDLGAGVAYTVKVNDTTYDVTTNSIKLTGLKSGANAVQVCAKKDGQTSLWSDVFTVNSGTKPENVSYAAGALTWNAVIGVSGYEVSVNGGAAVAVSGVSYAPEFTEAGEHTLAVRAVTVDGKTEWSETKVTVYAVAFNAQGGAAVDTLYKANGDKLELPASTHEFKNLEGWYTAANGQGEKLSAGKFEGSSNVTYYANWTNKTFQALYVSGSDFTVEGSDSKVVYSEAFTLAVPKHNNGTMAFVGWYNSPHGQGGRLTDEYGKSLGVWNTKSASVYPYFVEAFAFEETIDEQQQTVYSVRMGKQIDLINKITIPETYNGKPVAYITMGAFASCWELYEVNIPDTIKLVGASGGSGSTSGPFAYCSYLENINVYETGNAVDPAYTSIDGVLIFDNPNTGKRELSYFPAAKGGEYTIPDGVQVIPLRTFSSADITKLTVPASVTEIGETAFYTCMQLKEVIFLSAETDNGGLNISELAFQNCDELVKVTFPKHIAAEMAAGGAALFDSVFFGCEMLDTFAVSAEGGTYSAKDGVLYSGDGKTLVYYPRARQGAFEVPEAVETIAAGAFAEHRYLTQVTIPDSVTSIEVGAFKGCTNLAKVNFSGTARAIGATIGEEAFANCKALTNVVLAANSNVEVISKNAFANTGLSVFGLASTTETSVFPKTVETIAENAFAGTNLRTIAFEDGGDTLSLADNAFANIVRLMSIELPAALDNVNLNAFSGCSNLREFSVDENNANYSAKNGVLYNKTGTALLYYTKDAATDATFSSIFDGVTEIGANAFEGNATLTTITIPKTVTVVGESAFMGCTALTSVAFETGRTEELTFAASVFKNCISLNEVALPEMTANISASMFENAEALTAVTMQAGVTEIGASAFANTRLETLDMADSIVSIGANVFSGCSALTSVTLSEGLTVLPASLFAGCSNLSSVNIPEAVVTIGASAFQGTRIAEAAIPATVTSIGDSAFAGVSALTTLTFAEGGAEALAIGANAFKGTGVEAVVLPSRLVSVEADVFAGSALASLAFENDTVTGEDFVIKANAFKGLGLKAVVIPAGTVKVEASAFEGNASLATVEFKNGTADLTVEAMAFLGCKAMTSLTLPSNLKVLGGNLTEGFEELHLFGEEGTYSNGYVDTPPLGAINNLTSITLENNDTYYVENNVVYSGTVAVYAAGGITDAVTLKDGTTAIADGALSGVKFATVNMPETVASIGEHAFTNATFETLSIPASVVEIGAYAFFQATLDDIHFVAGTEELTFGNFAFAMATLPAFEVPARVKNLSRGIFAQAKLPEDFSFTLAENSQLTEIPEFAFFKSTLTKFDVPKGIKVIGGGAFGESPSLASVTIPNTVEEIRAGYVNPSSEPCLPSDDLWGSGAIGAFTSCKKLASITFEKGGTAELKFVNHVDDDDVGIFANCYALTSIEIPARVTSIPMNTFYMDSWYGTSMMTSLTFEEGSQLTFIDDGAFSGTAIVSVVVPDSVVAFGSESIGSDYSPYGPFSRCEKLESITLPASMQAFDKGIIYNTPSLKELKFTGTSVIYAIEDGVIYNKDKTTLIYYFAGKTDAEFVVPEGVTDIAPYSFYHGTDDYNQYLKKISLPASLKKIGNYAFSYAKITDITFAEGCELESIGSYAFSYSDIMAIDIPDTLKEMGSQAFYNCKKLTTLDMPTGGKLERIEGNTFYGSAQLKSIVIPEGVTWIGYAAFYNCYALESVVLPDSLEAMDGSVFTYCNSLKSVKLPENPAFKEIPNYTFQNCTALEEITIPDNIEVISSSAYGSEGYYYAAFSGCTSLKKVNISENSNLKRIEQAAFMSCTSLEEFYLPASIEYLGTKVFESCTSLKTLTIADGISIQAIGDRLFAECRSLTSVNIPITVTAIGAQAFLNCSSLEELDMRSGIETIGASAFEGCSALKELHIVDTVRDIGASAFTACSAIIMVDSANVNFLYNNGMLTDAFEVKVLYLNPEATGDLVIPETITSLAAGAFRNSLYTSIVIPEGISEIGDYMFANSKNLKRVVLPSTITKIGASAFEGCTALESIVIGKNVVSLGAKAFLGCTSLKEVIFEHGGSNIFQISDSAFENCTALESLDLPARLRSVYEIVKGTWWDSYVEKTAIGQGTFRGCTSLKTVTFSTVGLALIDKTLPLSLSYSAFENCTSLETIKLPTWLGYPEMNGYQGMPINSGAFRNCTSLKELPLPETLDNFDKLGISEYVFEGCTSLKKVVLPEWLDLTYNFLSNTSNNFMFLNCTALEEVTIVCPDNWTAYNMFQGCTSLTKVNIGAYVNSPIKMLPADTFNGCTSLASVTLPEGITCIASNAFANCTSLTSFEIPATVNQLAHQMDYYGDFVGISNPFVSCENLTITIAADNKNFKLVEGNLYSMDGKVLYMASASLTDFVIPEGVEQLAMSAFAYHKSLTSVVFPSTLRDDVENDIYAFGDNLFEGCSKLETVDFSKVTDAVEEIILDSMFLDCTSLKNVIFPENELTYAVGSSAFKNCTSLEWIDFSRINYIYDEAFMNCSSLTFDEDHKLTLDIEGIMKDAFDGCGTIYVDANYDERPGQYDWTYYEDSYYNPGYMATWFGDSTVVWNDQSISVPQP